MSDRMTLPVLPLRDAVLFPGVATPIGAGRPATLRAIEAALKQADRKVFAVAQKENVDQVSPAVLYTTGTIARISQVQRNLGGVQLILHGEGRGTAVHYSETNGYLEATVRETPDLPPLNEKDAAFVALHREVRERAAELGQKSGLPTEVVQQVLEGVSDPGALADLVAGHLDIQSVERQQLLETLAVEDRLRRVIVHVQRQIAVLDAQEDIKSQVQEELGERQREMLLREQMKAIRKELGEEGEAAEADDLKKRLDALELPEAARKEVDRELARLERAGRESMEAQVIRTYLETVAELPWSKRADESLDPKIRCSSSSRFASCASASRRRQRRGMRTTAPRARRRCCSSVRRALARRRSPSRLPARWAGRMSAFPLVARAMRRISAATGAPTSVPCRAASSRG